MSEILLRSRITRFSWAKTRQDRRSYLSFGETVQGVLNVVFYEQWENMADSDSGTHVTDISESFPDGEEGERNSYFHLGNFQTMVH